MTCKTCNGLGFCVSEVTVGGQPASVKEECETCCGLGVQPATASVPPEERLSEGLLKFAEGSPKWIDRRCGLMPAEHPRGG